MKHLKFCPKCGKETLVWEGKKMFCDHCDFVMYQNCAGAVAVLIKCKDEILFTKRNQEPKKGKLDLSGGFVDPNETAEETCKRELYEEMQIDIHLTQLKYLGTLPNIYHYKDIDYNTLDLFFEYEVSEKFEVKLEISEISEIIWLKKSEIKIDDIAFDSQKKFFEKYLNWN